MHPLLSQLNRRLKRRGEDVWLQRQTPGANGSRVRAKVPAIVQALTREQLVGAVTQQNLFVIISPTHLFDVSQWPGGFTASPQTSGVINPSDLRVPLTSDAIFVRGAQRAIQNCKPVFMEHECIRIEITCQG